VLASRRFFLCRAILAAALGVAFAADAFAAPRVPASKAAAPKAPAAKKEEGFQVAAPFAILIDASSGTVLYGKNADQLVCASSMA